MTGDELFARVWDECLSTPGCETAAIRQLTKMQDAFTELDTYLRSGGQLPQRWRNLPDGG